MYNFILLKINEHIRLAKPARCRQRLQRAGFTLIEMLVVIAIISVIIGVVVVNQRTFDNSIILSNTAYDVALSLREAQAYGHAGHGAPGISPVTYGTGIDFNITQKNTKKNTYTLFADTAGSGCYTAALGSIPQNSPAQKTGNCVYTNSDVPLRSFAINNGMFISKLCAGTNSGTKCSSSASPSFGQLDITSTRADVSTNIYISGGSFSSPQSASSACIEISSPDGKAHEKITVSNVGAIFVGRKTCP